MPKDSPHHARFSMYFPCITIVATQSQNTNHVFEILVSYDLVEPPKYIMGNINRPYRSVLSYMDAVSIISDAYKKILFCWLQYKNGKKT